MSHFTFHILCQKLKQIIRIFNRNRNDLAQTLETLKAQIDLGPSDQKQGDGSTCASPVPEDDENYADNEETKKGSPECYVLWKSLVNSSTVLTVTVVS